MDREKHLKALWEMDNYSSIRKTKCVAIINKIYEEVEQEIASLQYALTMSDYELCSSCLYYKLDYCRNKNSFCFNMHILEEDFGCKRWVLKC